MAPDRPLIYANEGFYRLAGLSIEETIGSNCRFLQGPDTDPASIKEIRDAIADERYGEVELLNYRTRNSPAGIFFRIALPLALVRVAWRRSAYTIFFAAILGFQTNT